MDSISEEIEIMNNKQTSNMDHISEKSMIKDLILKMYEMVQEDSSITTNKIDYNKETKELLTVNIYSFYKINMIYI